RWPRDWSSDVCSSDLSVLHTYASGRLEENVDRDSRVTSPAQRGGGGHAVQNTGSSRDSTEMITPWLLNLRQAAKYLGCSFWTIRSEERRVGKECRASG